MSSPQILWSALSSPCISRNDSPSVCVCACVGSSTLQSSIKDVSNDFTAVPTPTTVFVKSCSSVALVKSFSGIFCSTVIKSFRLLSKTFLACCAVRPANPQISLRIRAV